MRVTCHRNVYFRFVVVILFEAFDLSRHDTHEYLKLYADICNVCYVCMYIYIYIYIYLFIYVCGYIMYVYIIACLYKRLICHAIKCSAIYRVRQKREVPCRIFWISQQRIFIFIRKFTRLVYSHIYIIIAKLYYIVTPFD